jgi:low affinity Fe/Cu permease
MLVAFHGLELHRPPLSLHCISSRFTFIVMSISVSILVTFMPVIVQNYANMIDFLLEETGSKPTIFADSIIMSSSKLDAFVILASARFSSI